MKRVGMKPVWMWGLTLGILVGGVGCSDSSPTPSRSFNLYQDWALQPGDKVAGYSVRSSLGDIALDLQGNPLFMPFDGQVELASGQEDLCIVISSADVPAYLFRLCGVQRPQLGDRRQGDRLGNGDVVAFAAMRRQADGTWAMVEPAKELITQFIEAP
jgi:hypothetical protein